VSRSGSFATPVT